MGMQTLTCYYIKLMLYTYLDYCTAILLRMPLFSLSYLPLFDDGDLVSLEGSRRQKSYVVILLMMLGTFTWR